MNILKKNALNLSNGTLFLLSISISSFPIVASIVSVLFIFFNLFYAYTNKDEIEKVSLLNYLPIYIIFIILLISFTYSPDYELGLNIIFKSQAFLLFPIVFWARGGIDTQTLIKTKRFFIFGVGVSFLLSLSIAFNNYIGSENPSEFTYYELAETLELHPTYFSLYILSAMVFIFSDISKSYFFKAIFLIVSIVFIILLESRIAFLGLLLVISYGIFKMKLKYKKLILASSLLLVIIGALNSEGLKNRLIEVSTFDVSEEEIGTFQENGINQRSWLWTNALDQIKENPLFGYGLGSQKYYFKWQIEKKLLSENFNYEFNKAAISLSERNLHNQYLQFFYESGIFGLFLLLIGLFLMTTKFYKNKQHPQLVILFLFVIFLITENLFHRQMGIYFYAFLFSLFLSKNIESLK